MINILRNGDTCMVLTKDNLLGFLPATVHEIEMSFKVVYRSNDFDQYVECPRLRRRLEQLTFNLIQQGEIRLHKGLYERIYQKV
jgi:hypothetical protein